MIQFNFQMSEEDTESFFMMLQNSINSYHTRIIKEMVKCKCQCETDEHTCENKEYIHAYMDLHTYEKTLMKICAEGTKKIDETLTEG